MANTHHDVVQQIHGKAADGTFEVTPVECWRNGDAKRAVGFPVRTPGRPEGIEFYPGMDTGGGSTTAQRAAGALRALIAYKGDPDLPLPDLVSDLLTDCGHLMQAMGYNGVQSILDMAEKSAAGLIDEQDLRAHVGQNSPSRQSFIGFPGIEELKLAPREEGEQ